MNECKFCHKNLEELEEVHAMYGMLFCSKTCAVAYNEREIIRNAHDVAEEDYCDAAEIVSTKDIMPKAKFMVSVVELLERTVEIEAVNEFEAVATAEGMWNDSAICLTADDFSHVSFTVLGKCE